MLNFRFVLVCLVCFAFLLACNETVPTNNTQAPLLPQIDFFRADATTVTAGDKVSFSWKVSNADSFSCAFGETIGSKAKTTKSIPCEASLDTEPGATTVFTLEVLDASAKIFLTDERTVQVETSSFNQAPFVNNDEYDFTKGGLLSVSASEGVLANDEDINGDVMAAVLVKDVAFGELNLASDGSFTYQHDGNISEVDSFTYTASDGQATSTTVTAFLKLTTEPDPIPNPDPTPDPNPTPDPTPTNTAPFAFGDEYSLEQSATLTIGSERGVLKNDGDDDGDDIAVELVEDVSHGSLTLNTDGSFNYTHNGNDAKTDTFMYKVSDGKLDSNVVSVGLIISEPKNTAPVARDDNYTLEQGSTLERTASNGVLANDSDADEDDLSVSLVTDVTSGILTLRANGAFAYTHDGSDSETDSFSYKLSDGKVSAIATVDLSITLKEVPEPTPTEIVRRINRGSDDTEQYVAINYRWGDMFNSGVDLDIGRDLETHKAVGLRFTNITLDKDSKIDEAFIQFTAVEENASFGSASINVFLITQANPSTFGTAPFSLSDLPRKSIRIWSPPVWSKGGEQGAKQRVDVTELVEAALENSGWKSGNAIAIALNNEDSGGRIAESFEGNSAKAPTLVIRTK